MGNSDLEQLIRRLAREEAIKLFESYVESMNRGVKKPIQNTVDSKRLSTRDAAKRLGVHPLTLKKWAKECDVHPGRSGRSDFYLESDITKIEIGKEKRARDVPDGYLTLKHAAGILEVSPATLISWAKSLKIPATKKKGRWLFIEHDVDAAAVFLKGSSNKIPPGYIVRRQAVDKYVVNSQTLSNWYKDKSVHTIFRNHRYMFKEEDVVKRLNARKKTNRVVPEGYMLFSEVANKLGISFQTLRKRLNEGKVKGIKEGGRWLFLEEHINKLYEQESLYLNYKQAAEYYNVSEQTIFDWAKTERISAVKIDGQWKFPKDHLHEPLPAKGKVIEVPEGYITFKEAAKRLNVSKSALHHRVSTNKIKGEKIGPYLFFREDVIEAFVSNQSEYITTGEATRFLHVSSNTVLKWAKEGKIPFTKERGILLFRKSDIRQFLKESRRIKNRS